MNELDEGMYLLTENVINSRADRRSNKRLDKMLVWPKDLRIVCKKGTSIFHLSSPNMMGRIDLFTSDKDYWGPLVNKLVPLNCNLADLLDKLKTLDQLYPQDILMILVDKQLITSSNIQDVANELKNMSHDLFNAMCERHGFKY